MAPGLRSARDSLGREVVLPAASWSDILEHHREMHCHLKGIFDAVSSPIRTRARQANREEIWARGLSPGRWLRVVVQYEGESGRNITRPRVQQGPETEGAALSVRIGPYTFDKVSYDRDGDVLYMSNGREGLAERTPEGHVWIYRDGQVVGLDFISPRFLLDEEGALWVTLPSGERVNAREAAAAVN